MAQLPIEAVLPELRRTLAAETGAVLVAEPGAGKTTRVPLALRNEPWLGGRRIVMLEPRRLAARAAARFLAASLGERVGETVGYRVRQDTKVGPGTRIEVVTEGVLTRMLQADPSLEGIGLVIFDEFHERSLAADLGLGLCLQARELLNGDLRLLVMSATMDAEAVAALLGGARVLASPGRVYPVETVYRERRMEGRLEDEAAAAIREALAQTVGDLLVFLPGEGEIRRVQARLASPAGPGADGSVRVAPLFGSLPQEEQDAALAPAPPGVRKVVLATSIAETSLTVEGVRVVVDAGLSRVPRFSPRTGLTRLETVRVSRASADQRRGRAGRLGPGVCFRLWTAEEDRQLAPHSAPEIREADLASLALELAAWGAAPDELAWLDPPPPGAYAQACELLAELGALGPDGAITPHGRRMARLGLAPRLAHMLLRAEPLGLGGLACELAALLGERDLLRGRGASADADMRLRVEALRGGGRRSLPAEAAVDPAARQRVVAEAKRLREALGVPAGQAASAGADGDAEAAGLLLAFAYPDRIGQRRGGLRYLLSGGRGAAFAGQQPLAQAPYIVAAELDDQGPDSRIYLAAPLAQEELERCFGERIRTETTVAWDRAAQAVRARRRVALGALTLHEGPVGDPDPERTTAALMDGIRQEGLGLLPWTKGARQLRERIGFLHRHEPSWPDMSDEALLGTLEDWLAPYAGGLRSREDLQRLKLAELLEAMLPWERRRRLDEEAPTHLAVPSGSRIPVDYSDPDAPALNVRLQEVFGWTETPRIAAGRAPLTMHLLSPAQRPVQVTRDLASFWRSAYFEVKKDLKGRYPKHYWPDDPLTAMPTNRAKPRNG